MSCVGARVCVFVRAMRGMTVDHLVIDSGVPGTVRPVDVPVTVYYYTCLCVLWGDRLVSCAWQEGTRGVENVASGFIGTA